MREWRIDPCGDLANCCAALTGRRSTACNAIANAQNANECTLVTDTFCGAGSDAGGGGGGDAFVNCTDLADCCANLPDGGRAARRCDAIATNHNDALCNRASTVYCN